MSIRIKEGDSKLTIPRLDGGGEPIYHYEGKPFTGIVFKNHNDGVVLAWEKEYENGFQEGWVRRYFLSGEKRQEYKAHNNEEIDGSYKEWDENGNLILSY